MPSKMDRTIKVPQESLRWKLDPATLPFETTDDLEPPSDIIGQGRGVEAFRFGMGMDRKGYNIFVTGPAGTGKMFTVKKLLKELSDDRATPDDLCYVNNFKHPESPVLLRFAPGRGAAFKKAVQEFLDNVKKEVPQLFESEEYIARKNEIMEAHEKQVREFYKGVEEKVKDTDLVVVNMQMGPVQRPDVVPLVDGEPKRMVEVEEMVEKGRFPQEELERLKQRRLEVKEELDQIVIQVKQLNKEVKDKSEEVDRLMFLALAREHMQPLRDEFCQGDNAEKIERHLDAVLDDMVENMDALKMLGAKPQQAGPMMMMAPPPEVVFHPYQVNLLVDNAEQDGPPVIIESYPTYRNLFGSIERIMDRNGGWRTDFTKIKAGSFVKANGGFLVLNLMDAIMEPGVWQTLKRSLKTEAIEIQTFDPYYFITATGLKPESIPMQVKVVVTGDPRLYHLLRHYDPDTQKIFKVRADIETSMDRTDENVLQVARFVRAVVQRHEHKPFHASAVSRITERAVRMAGRQEKISTAFPRLSDLVDEAAYFASRCSACDTVTAEHVEQAVEAKIHRSNQIEEQLQEMIDRGSLFVDTDGSEVGQINGLAVYSMGDHMFGKPSRITAVTSLGKEGVINIEREADLSGPTHNKGMLILAGWLRRMFAQDKPMALAASIAFEQSYGGVDGDSASSTELYALLSSLSGLPIRQDIAVTGSVNQKGEVQPIGGVNEKIEGFYLCCKRAGLTGRQGVLIPRANVKDLMLRQEVVDAVAEGRFHVWAASSVEQGAELLMGKPAGKRGKNGNYPKTSIFGRADAALAEMAEALQKFGKDDKEEKDS
ncbi:lon-related putative ATP-dependent protease [Paucidesulfovibrio gracilis DSM 16080]|uniref:endopeptidase La n=1 Tax=Paucidesulfovibrio gracilis DSM 16080 TaxID=1121449 RepID=A0A1T4XPS4_9BACT|nr:ATP-binding protein [Paucidesulfovibrio gracilis]SKA91532.1 lon-related putative ATP-dependent protease [Paucidesulfovibrio gracilis DSM 16080]